MRWVQLLQAVGSEPVFETGLLIAGDVDPKDVRRQLSRWTAAGRLVQLRRGVYAFGQAEAVGRRTPEPFGLANRLVRASYVSTESALAYHGLIPEYVPVVTSVTARRPGRFDTPLGSFVYRHVKPAMLWGYRSVPVTREATALIADPEKALVDLFYLEPASAAPEFLDGLRLQNLDRIDLEGLVGMATRTGLARVVRAAGMVREMASRDAEEYVTL
jgi:predicted transcriptional regulator of viral defense system